ncbi:MAG TPA: beta-galactosidase GalA [Chitinophagaceae bacterium]|nr:beta-galactosidase GalA [Chitinophagaceae bacterium]
MKSKLITLVSFAAVVITNTRAQTAQAFSPGAMPPRVRLSMDSGWKFRLGDYPKFEENIINAGVNKGPAAVSFNDNSWRSVNIPHDWAVELPFDKRADGSHGYKPIGRGFPANSTGWYRRSFTLSKSDKGKRLCLEFDGVYRKCQVFLNGYRLAHHEGGYTGFRCDITDVADYDGKNVLAVRVDASESEGWFYEGAGIYRHVWLVKTAPLAVAPDGIFVYSSFPGNFPAGTATIHIETKLCNSQDSMAHAKLHWQVLAPNGEVISEATGSEAVGSWQPKQISGTTEVTAPVLWSPESPALYKLVTTVETDGKMVDYKETEFGIRTLAFDPNEGFLLNGRHYEVRGTCNHQDHAGVGVAVPDALWDFRVRKLKEMGCNAIRTSHNEPAAELLEACDRLGMLVMDETRYFGSDPQSLDNLRQQVCRDRNHPSVFLWSLANEEPLHASVADGAITLTMRRTVHTLDTTRLCTAAIYDWPVGKPYGISVGIDVQGFNYFDQGETDLFHKNNPNKPSIGTEEGMAQYTRGIYQNTSTYLSAYDIQKPDCRHTAEESIQYYAARPWIAGMFFWTGFDYRGEPAPFGWPNICSDFGIMDVCGFPKDIFYYLQSCWTDKPMVHLLPHWNWPGKEGQDIDIWAYSNCNEVELFLNGRSVGKKTIPKNSHALWTVKYQPGVLLAKAYRDGKMIAEEKVETTGAPDAVKLTADRTAINADGKDLSVITVAVTDEKGRVVPVASNLIEFELNGPGKIIGVGNGDPISHEADVLIDTPLTHNILLEGWRMHAVSAAADSSQLLTNYDDSHWQRVDAGKETGSLKPGMEGVFRAHFIIKADDIENSSCIIRFGMIDDDGWVFINGKLVGESHDWQSEQSFDIKQFLQPGANTVAVLVKNKGGAGGISKGVTVELTKNHIPLHWRRSVFTGLAQVIIQSDKTSGEIKLTAHAKGLQQGSITIHSAGSPVIAGN